MADIEELRKKIVIGSRILYNEGICGKFPFGHLSARHPDGDKFIISYKGHGEGRHVGEVVMEDLQVLDLEGNFVEGTHKEFYDEIFAHSEIYKARPDVMSVSHVHPPVAKSICTTDAEIIPIVGAGTNLSAGVKKFEHPSGKPRLIGTKEDGVLLAQCLGNGKAVAIRGLAIDVVGTSVEDAVTSSIGLEETAKMLVSARTVGTPKRFEMSSMPPRPPGSPPSPESRGSLLWIYYVRRLADSKWAINL